VEGTSTDNRSIELCGSASKPADRAFVHQRALAFYSGFFYSIRAFKCPSNHSSTVLYHSSELRGFNTQ